MVQEDQTQSSSGTSCGGGGGGGGGSLGGGGGGGGSISNNGSCVVRCSNYKKQKPKKIPQRGLGVAQLERIRLEEQLKKDPLTLLPTPSSSSNNNNNITPNFNPSNQPISSPSIPFSPQDPPSQNSIFRIPSSSSSSSFHNFETLNSSTNTVHPTFNSNPLGWSSSNIPVNNPQGHGNIRKFWNSCDLNSLGKDGTLNGSDPGSGFRSNFNHLPLESNSIWPIPSFIPRPQQYQQSSSTSSMTNVSSSATISSSVFQMEFPSNQNYYNNYTPVWSEEQKMVGMKRPYPYSLESPPGFPSFPNKIPAFVHPITRSDDSASCGNGHTPLNPEPTSTIFREGSSGSISILEQDSKKTVKENNGVNNGGGGFLTLAPPTTNSMSSRLKNPFTNYHEFPDFESLPCQGSSNVEETTLRPGLGGLNQRQPPYYSFFPQGMAQNGDQPAEDVNNSNGGEVGESVDLNLKL